MPGFRRVPLDMLEHRLEKDDQLCFVRLPKTGSTTLVSILDSHFHAEEIFPHSLAAVSHLPPDEFTKYRLFREHCDYDFHQFLPKKPIYLTMLRHPIGRSISYYKHCKRSRIQKPYDTLLREATAQGLKQFIAHPDPTVRIRTSNLQTRKIACGMGSRHVRPLEPSPLESKYSDAELLALAKEHLQEFALVGITERFQDSVSLLNFIFGWYPTAEYQNLRVSKSGQEDELDQATIDTILEVNQLDLELYQEAQKIFESQFASMVQTLRQRYGSNLDGSNHLDDPEQALPGWLQHHYESRYREQELSPLGKLDFDFRPAISGSGWHRRHGKRTGARQGEHTFRWTGPGTESTLDFPIANEKELIIRIRVANTAAPDILASLQLQVNDAPIPLEMLSKRLNSAIFQGRVLPAHLTSDRPFTRLTFRVNHTATLKETSTGGTDKRIVGLAIDRIQIFPADADPEALGYGDLHHLIYSEVSFPSPDPRWQQAVAFLEQHCPPTEKVIAPPEFVDEFPDRFCSYLNPWQHSPSVNWVVIHKGLLSEVDYASLKWTIKNLHPVFANEVFIIFCNRPEIAQANDKQSPHDFRSFWYDWIILNLERVVGKEFFAVKLLRQFKQRRS